MARPKKPKAAKGKAKGKADPKKRARKTPSPKPAPTPKLSKPRTPAKRPKAAAPKAAPKPARKAAQPAQKAPRKVAKRPAAKRPKKLSRAYEARLRRAQMVGQALGFDEHQIKSIARGHPDRAKGELGLNEIRYLKAAAQLPSRGQQSQAGETRPVHYELRAIARTRLADVLGLSPTVPGSSPAARRSAAAERFAEAFAALGLGSLHDGYTLWFSP